MALYGPPIQRERGHSLSRLQTPFADAVAASAEDAFYHNPVNALGRIVGLQAERLDRVSDVLSPEELNERYGELGLHFDRAERRGAAEVIARRKLDELERRNRLSRTSKDIGTQSALFLTALATSVADPINVASAFVPVVGQTRYAIWAERFGATGARFSRGAVEGAAGAALVEPLILGAAEFDQSDYGYLDSLLNVVFGTALGGGLHTGFGKISDYLGRTDPAAREGALRAAVAQAAEGRPVDVAHILRTDPRFQGGEAAFDPLDPRFIPELNSRVRPPPARQFDLGPGVGRGQAVTYPNYSRIGAEDLRIMESLVMELRGTEGGHVVFQDNPFGPGQDIRGVEGTTPEWFRHINDDAAHNRRERRKAARRPGQAANEAQLKSLRKELREAKGTEASRIEREIADVERQTVRPGDFGPETVLTRAKVENVFNKLRERKPLGREEGEIAEILFDVARGIRQERIDHIVAEREARAEESRAEIDAFAQRERYDMEGRLDLGPDDEGAIRDAQEAEARKAEESTLPDEEIVDEELEFLTGEIEAMRAQGALTDEDVAAGRLDDDDIGSETVKAHGDAAEAAARCLLLHP